MVKGICDRHRWELAATGGSGDARFAVTRRDGSEDAYRLD